MNVQFDWWLILVGFVLGAGLAWLVLAELHRREDDLAAREREVEAEWIAADMNAHGFPADAEAVGEVLRLHRTYLASIPPSEADLGLQEGEPADAGETEASEASDASALPGASGVSAEPAGSASDASDASDASEASTPRQAAWQPEPRPTGQAVPSTPAGGAPRHSPSANPADKEDPRPVP